MYESSQRVWKNQGSKGAKVKHLCETPEASLEGGMALPIINYTQVKDNNSLGSMLSSEPGQIHSMEL